MKGMASAAEYFVPPPAGQYPCIIKEANPSISKKEATMLELTVEIAEGFAQGTQANDYIITDGTKPGGGMGKTKLRALGVDVTSDAEVPDEVVARSLVNKRCYVTFEHETQKSKDSGYTQAMTALDPRTNQMVELKKLVVKGYSLTQTAAMPQPPQNHAPATPAPQAQAGWGQPPAQQAPQGSAFAAPPQQGWAQPQAPQGFAPPAQPGFAAPPPGAPVQSPWAGQAPQAPQQAQGFAAPPFQAPQGFAPPAVPGMQTPAWAAQGKGG